MTRINASSWPLLLLFSILFSLVMGFGIVWISIEKRNAVYRVSHLKQELAQRVALNTKLQIERDRLLNPSDLRKHARELGLHQAGSGQIRKIPMPNPDKRGRR